MADKKTEPARPAKKAEPATTEPVGFTPKAVHIGGESFVDRVLPHMKKIVFVAIGTTLVLSIVFFVRWLGERKEVKHTEELTEVLTVASGKIKPPGADPKQGSGFTDVKDRGTAVLNAIAQQNTDAEGHAFRAGLLVDTGKLDDAIAEYRAGQDDPGLEGVLCREGLGMALETKATTVDKANAAASQKDLEDALAAFKAMQPDDNGPRRAYALYHQGRALQLLGKNADAKTAYTKANELGTGTDLPPLIASRLASLGAS